MLIKHIICQVKEEKRVAFSKAQEQWSGLKGLNGFIAQFGGWSQDNSERAHIISCWQNQAWYDHFMSVQHDQIIGQNHQAQTYQCIEVHFYNTVKNQSFPQERLLKNLSRITHLSLAKLDAKQTEVLAVLDQMYQYENKDILFLIPSYLPNDQSDLLLLHSEESLLNSGLFAENTNAKLTLSEKIRINKKWIV